MPRILVIDDVDLVRASIRRTLEQEGYEVFEAQNGKVGLELIKRLAMDAVITDIYMPEAEGLETIQRIVRCKRDLPVIAMTGEGGTLFLKTALAFGADCALHKPFQREELLSALRRVLQKADRQAGAQF